MADAVNYLSLDALKPHPRNEEFFSNIDGEDYERLKQSISELGVLTPLRVASDMTIISGHQRYRAAKELEFTQVPVVIDQNLLNEDDKLQQLIASNFGRLKNDPIKQAKWLKEYERLRGVREGAGRYSKEMRPNGAISQADIAKELGVDRRSLQRLKQLLTLYPEMQDLVSSGKISISTGSRLIARLTEEEQKQLLAQLPATEKLTSSEVQKYIDKIKGLETDKQKAQARIAELEREAKSDDDESQVEELEFRLNAALAKNKNLEEELGKTATALAEARKKEKRDKKSSEASKSDMKQLEQFIAATTNPESADVGKTASQKATERERVEFCYRVSLFDTDLTSKVLYLEDMGGYCDADRNDCIRHMKNIIESCEKIIAFWN